MPDTQTNKRRFRLERSGTGNVGIYFDKEDLVYVIRVMCSNSETIRRYQLAEYHEAEAFLDGWDSALGGF